ncbi:DinB family protein [Helicobacter pylori]
MADLKTVLHDMLKTQRAALLLKLDGLDEYEARRPRTPTGTNLLGLLKHSAACELGYFGETFGRPSELVLPWEVEGVDPDDNEDMFATEDESMADVLAWCRACFDHADILREHIDGRVGLRSEGNNLPEWDEGRWARYVERLTRIADERA